MFGTPFSHSDSMSGWGGNYVYANVNDNVLNSALEVKVGETNDSGRSTLFGLLNQLFDVIGIAHIDSVPEDDEYPQATLVEKVNYIEKELRSVFQSASDGKLLLQSSLANEGISISKTTPQDFDTINRSLAGLIDKYKTQLGQLDAELIKARANGTLIVSSRGWSGDYDGNNHSISVTVDTEAYDIKYGTSADNCTLVSSPVYKAYGDYTVYYSIIGKENRKSMQGSETVSIKPLAGKVTLSCYSAEVPKGSTTSVIATNKSGGNVNAVSSNTGVATVSKSGNNFTINGISPGTCTITFIGERSDSTAGASTSMNITVLNGYTLTYNLSSVGSFLRYSSSTGYPSRTLSSYICLTYYDVYGTRHKIYSTNPANTGSVLVKAGTTVTYTCYSTLELDWSSCGIRIDELYYLTDNETKYGQAHCASTVAGTNYGEEVAKSYSITMYSNKTINCKSVVYGADNIVVDNLIFTHSVN